MKIKANKNDLIKSINTANKAVALKTTMPILECMLIIVEDDVRLMANNTELGIETVLKAEIEEPGRVAIEAKILNDVIRKMPDGDITITADENSCTIKNGRSKFKLSVRDASEYPYIEKIDKTDPVNISQYELKTVINQTIFSVAVNEANKMLTGVLFDVAGDKLNVVALDGHRVAIRHIDLDKEYTNRSVVIPGKTLGEIAKILDDGFASIYVSKNNIMFEFDDTVMVSRLIEGQYLDISKLKNDNFNTTLTIDRDSLIDCLDRSSLLIGVNDRKPIILTINDEGSGVSIVTNTGSMNESIDAKKNGEDIKIGINPRFVLDALKAIEDDTVHLYFINQKSPLYIRDDAETYEYIILPIQI